MSALLTGIAAPAAGTNLGFADLPGGVKAAGAVLVDAANEEVLGQVTANPGALTLLGRLKTIADGITTLAGHVDGLEGLATSLNGFVDGLEALLGTTNSSLTSIAGYVDGLEALAITLNGYVDGLETLGAAQSAALATVGTRAYGTAENRLAINSAGAASSGITATEVLLHASSRCFVKSGSGTPTATVNDIPLEAGEKFHMRITSGHKIAVIRDTADGFLNIVPVA